MGHLPPAIAPVRSPGPLIPPCRRSAPGSQAFAAFAEGLGGLLQHPAFSWSFSFRSAAGSPPAPRRLWKSQRARRPRNFNLGQFIKMHVPAAPPLGNR